MSLTHVPTSVSNADRTNYSQFLNEMNERGKWSDFKRKVDPPDLYSEQQKLHKSPESALRRSGRFLRSCLNRMKKCRINKPCKTLGCPRCGRYCNFAIARRDAKIISSHTTSGRGRALAVTLTSENWKGKPYLVVHKLVQDMLGFVDDLKSCEAALVDGYVFQLDAVFDGESNPSELLDEANALLHVHGTILVKFHAIRKFGQSINELATDRNIKADVRPLRSTYRTRTDVKKNEIVTYGDAVRWTCYSSKLQSRGKNTPQEMRVFQRTFFGIQREWRGGRLDFKGPSADTLGDSDTEENANALNGRVKIINKWIQHLTIFKKRFGNLDRTDAVTPIIKSLESIRDALMRAGERVRRRFERKRSSTAKLKSQFQGARLADKLAKRNARSNNIRNGRSNPDRLRGEEKRLDVQWKTAESLTVDFVLSIGKELFAEPAVLNGLLEQYLEGNYESGLIANSATIVASACISARRLGDLQLRVRKLDNRFGLCNGPDEQRLTDELGIEAELFTDLDELFPGMGAALELNYKEEATRKQAVGSFEAALRAWVSIAVLETARDTKGMAIPPPARL